MRIFYDWRASHSWKCVIATYGLLLRRSPGPTTIAARMDITWHQEVTLGSIGIEHELHHNGGVSTG